MKLSNRLGKKLSLAGIVAAIFFLLPGCPTTPIPLPEIEWTVVSAGYDGQTRIILEIDSSAGIYPVSGTLFLDEAGTMPVDEMTLFTIPGKEITSVSVGGTIRLDSPLDPVEDAGIELTIDPVWMYRQRYYSFGDYYAMVAKGRFQPASIQITFPD